MKKLVNLACCIIMTTVFFLLPFTHVKGYTYWSAYTSISGSLTVRSTPARTSNNMIEEIPPYISFKVIDEQSSSDSVCPKFYKIDYYSEENDKWMNGWVCSASIVKSSNYESSYGRPWTTPGKAINGGAQIIASSYIAKGQFTSYLKKFQVNPAYTLYSHQYMTNIRAPWGEARTTYKAYSEYLNDIAFTFTIPIYESMPEETKLSGMVATGTALTAEQLNDADFEAELNKQGFPESYKKYLRGLHKTYPKWKFAGLKTEIAWDNAIDSERSLSCIETSSGHGTSEACGRESASWARADDDSIKFFMDPRNFLDKESIFMFEDLSSYSNVTETMVQRILTGTFMSNSSTKDNQKYATIFMNAGKSNNINPIYLASLAVQEIGNGGNIQTTGGEFTYYGIKYSSLYNFFNIGATGTFTARGGLVWASGGSPSTFTFTHDISSSESEIKPPVSLDASLTNAGLTIDGSLVNNISLETTANTLKSKISGVTVKIMNADKSELSGSSIIGTGNIIELSNGTTTYQKTVVVSGDVSGDGAIMANDYVYIKNHIMEVIKLSDAQQKASDMNKNAMVDAGDYIAIKNYIMSH